VDEKYSTPYRRDKLPADFYGMIANIDENMGRMEEFLRRTGLRDNTIVIFMTDNGGTAGVRTYNAGLRAGKTTYYDGGHRVPCFVRWPVGRLRPPADVDVPTQIQDLLPTLSDYVPISIGSPQENPVFLSSSDWEVVYCDNVGHVREAAGGPQGSSWHVEVEREGEYEIELRRWPFHTDSPLASTGPSATVYGRPIASGKGLPIAGAILEIAG